MDPNNPFTRSFPTSLLDGLWSLLQQLLSLLPRDTALLVTLSGLMFTLFQTWDRILNFIQAWFWCSVRVSDDDSFYPLLLKWSHTMLRTGYHRNLEATTVAFQAWTDKGDIITTDWQGHSLCNYANHMVPYVVRLASKLSYEIC